MSDEHAARVAAAWRAVYEALEQLRRTSLEVFGDDPEGMQALLDDISSPYAGAAPVPHGLSAEFYKRATRNRR